MKIAFVGDIHLADRDLADPFTLKKRLHITDHDNFDREFIDHLNSSDVDHFIFLGDLIDWYSPENINIGCRYLDRLNNPWHMTPGNHDYQLDLRLRPEFNNKKIHSWADETPLICKKRAISDWNKNGVELKTRKLALAGINLYLIDSAIGYISREDQNWLITELNEHKSEFNVLATHVPLPSTPTDGKFSELQKPSGIYIQSGIINGFEDCLLDTVNKVYCGHVHFKEITTKKNIEYNMVSLATGYGENEKFECVSFLEL